MSSWLSSVDLGKAHLLHDFSNGQCAHACGQRPMYLMATTEPETVMVALEHMIIHATDHDERGRAMRALADLMAVTT